MGGRRRTRPDAHKGAARGAERSRESLDRHGVTHSWATVHSVYPDGRLDLKRDANVGSDGQAIPDGAPTPVVGVAHRIVPGDRVQVAHSGGHATVVGRRGRASDRPVEDKYDKSGGTLTGNAKVRKSKPAIDLEDTDQGADVFRLEKNGNELRFAKIRANGSSVVPLAVDANERVVLDSHPQNSMNPVTLGFGDEHYAPDAHEHGRYADAAHGHGQYATNTEHNQLVNAYNNHNHNAAYINNGETAHGQVHAVTVPVLVVVAGMLINTNPGMAWSMLSLVALVVLAPFVLSLAANRRKRLRAAPVPFEGDLHEAQQRGYSEVRYVEVDGDEEGGDEGGDAEHGDEGGDG